MSTMLWSISMLSKNRKASSRVNKHGGENEDARYLIKNTVNSMYLKETVVFLQRKHHLNTYASNGEIGTYF
jgi:hypothetical protein